MANQVAYIVIIVFTGKFTDGYQIYASAFILFQLPARDLRRVDLHRAAAAACPADGRAGDIDGLRTLFSRGIRDTVVVIVPAALGYIALAVRHRQPACCSTGAPTRADAENIAHTLQAFAVGLPFFSAFQLLTRTFYAMQDTRTPALVNVAAAVVNVAANLLYLSFDWGVPGLALGHATSYVFATLVCLVVLRKRLGRIDGARIASTLVRVIPAALLAAGAAFLASRGVSHAFDGATGTLARLLEVSVGGCGGRACVRDVGAYRGHRRSR